MAEGLDALTDREKETLRLLAQGHDAKSIARHFDLSVHTINERLRFARRKLSVSSSREAARMLRRQERAHSETSADEPLGEARAAPRVPSGVDRPRGQSRRARTIGGIAIMSTLIAALALALSAQQGAAPVDAAPAVAATESNAVQAARQWLALVDASRWDASYDGTSEAFQGLNTREVWASVSQEARVPLGAVASRTVRSQEAVPAPPRGYEIVRFRTSFAEKSGATETLSLMREDGAWKVAGYWIE